MKRLFWKSMLCGAACVVLVGMGSATMGEAVGEDARRCVPRSRQQSTQVVPGRRAAGLVIVPFAVPVAVPVAVPFAVPVVQQPALFYRVRADAVPPDGMSPALPSELEADVVDGAGEQVVGTAERVLRRRCAACHTDGDARSTLTLFDGDGGLLKRLPRQLILEMVTEDGEQPARMPPVPLEKLTERDVEVIRQWARVTRRTVY